MSIKSKKASKPLDPLVPTELYALQTWFGHTIERPLNATGGIQKLTPNNKPIEEETAQWVTPSPTLAPHQRVEIYNQQYWYRLVDVLHDHFPLTVRLFGYDTFNEKIGVPYLQAYPPNTWSLGRLGASLSSWIAKSYLLEDREAVFEATQIDWAFHQGFTAKSYPPLWESNDSPEYWLKTPLSLQPHVTLVTTQRDWFIHRTTFLDQSVEYWLDHPFPCLDKQDAPYHYVIYRNPTTMSPTWQAISSVDHEILTHLSQGVPLASICEELLSDETDGYTLAESIQAWVLQRWLTSSPAKNDVH